tara:strand:- start:549 stop:1079 length:531 start_codon:yes stop_codon:yes gene_type:complete
MASELHVDAIKHSGGTSALTIDSSGNVHGAGLSLQTLEGFSYTRVTSTSETFVDTGVSIAITPKFSSSKVLIICKHTFETNGNEGARAGLRLLRGSTNIAEIDNMIAYNYVSGEASVTGGTGVGLFIDSPSTTSATTYKTQFCRNFDGGGTVYCNADDSGSYERSRGSIIVMEIAQ